MNVGCVNPRRLTDPWLARLAKKLVDALRNNAVGMPGSTDESTMNDIIGGARRKLNKKAIPWALRGKFGSAGLNPAASRNIAVFPKLNLAFNRVKKNGNSTTVSLLYALEEGSVAKTHRAKRHSAFVRKANLTLLMNAGGYFHFVIVRDPFSRTLSAFLNKFSKPIYVDRFGSFDLTPEGFTRFVEWLAKSGLATDAHWNLQKKLIIGPLENFDAVLRFEDFPHCLEDLLHKRGLAFPDAAETILQSVHTDTRTGADRKLEQFYSPDSIAMVRALYKEDFDFLGYSAEFMLTSDRRSDTSFPLQTDRAVS
jgi:hypothetical protein